jgi:hypothetical protein
MAESLRQRWRGCSAALLFACAGVAVVAGAICGSAGWGDCTPAGLCFLLAGIALSLCAMARWKREISPDEPVRGRGSRRQRWMPAALIVILLIHGAVAVHFCKRVAATNIDCYIFQRDGWQKLMHGVDPYGTTSMNVYGPVESRVFYKPGMAVDGRVQEGIPYPPLTLYWLLPGYLLGDVRYSYILAVMIAAGFCYAMAPGWRGLCLAAFLLLSPLTFFVENRCWTEPLALMMLCVTMYAAMKRRWWLPVALGLLLASKQYNLLALPFTGYLVFPFAWRRWWRLVGWSLAVAAATVLPFAWWNLKGLWHDTVVYLLALPPRTDAITFAVYFPFAVKAGPLLLVVFLVWCVRSRRPSAAMFAAGYGTALLLIFSTGSLAFCNYYFLIGQALLLAAGAATIHAQRGSSGGLGDGDGAGHSGW